MKYAIAVLDIGKTNKKIRIYDDTLKPIVSRKCHIDTYRLEELDIEDVVSIEEWFLDGLAELNGEYPIRAISITTHGASVVCTGADGKPAVPPVAYTNEVDEAFHTAFFETVGATREELQAETITAEVKPLINVGKLIFFLQRRFPDEFKKVQRVFLYPQYFAYRLTGVSAADITYTGCHSYLWNPHKGDWSCVVDRLGIRALMPDRPIEPTGTLGRISPKVVTRTGLPPETIVTPGIHDSNSSLVPYLITRNEDFVLNSTGTWCVAMHPTDTLTFTPDELGKTVFYNLDYRSRPVKTSIVMAGLEYETYTELLKERAVAGEVTGHGTQPGTSAAGTALTDPGYDAPLYERLIREARTFILPAVLRGTGQFPESEARIVEFEAPAVTEAQTDSRTVTTLVAIRSGTPLPQSLSNWNEAIALVNLSVAIQSAVALKRVDLQPGTTIYTEGGFRNNEAYLTLLGALLPDNPVALTSIEEATSFGAALCGKAALEERPVEELHDAVQLIIQPVPFRSVPEIDGYMERFLELVEE